MMVLLSIPKNIINFLSICHSNESFCWKGNNDITSYYLLQENIYRVIFNITAIFSQLLLCPSWLKMKDIKKTPCKIFQRSWSDVYLLMEYTVWKMEVDPFSVILKNDPFPLESKNMRLKFFCRQRKESFLFFLPPGTKQMLKRQDEWWKSRKKKKEVFF